MPEKIIERSAEKEFKEAYREYAEAVITDRALPDARDGLKPVQRRVLFAMNELHLAPDKPHKKSARIVGDVIGKYHPHGDSAAYETMVRMAQDFSFRYPLVDGHGNFGSIDGDFAAAMRYTEARLSPFAILMLEDIEVVPFQPNFDESLQEPAVLPSKIPNLIINGASGIAVGMSTTIVPHHGKEVMKALIALLKNPEEDVTKHIKGPDFPTGGTYINPGEWKTIVETGLGKITIRANYKIEEDKSKKRIVFTDLPYQIKKAKLIERIALLVRDNKIQGITDLRDESDRQGIRFVIEVKKEVDENYILHELFRLTPLETHVYVQNQVLVDGKPQVLGLKSLMQVFTQHRLEILHAKLSRFLQIEGGRHHLLEGQVKALKNIPFLIKTMQGSLNKEEAKALLIKKLNLSDKQADSILQIRLSTLTSMEKEEVERRLKESEKRIKQLTYDLQHLPEVLENEWKEILPYFKAPRKTLIEKNKPHLPLLPKKRKKK